MTELGAIFLHRKMRDHYLWKEKPFTRALAWIDMILQANYEDARVFYGGNFYEIRRGQFIRTERDLAHDWGWSRSKVTRFLILLKNDSMIDSKPNPKANLITILNYDKYQILRTTKKPKLNQPRTKREPTVNLNNNENNENNERKDIEGFPLPDWIPQKSWDAFIQMRIRIKKTLSDHAKESAIKKLEYLKQQGHDPGKVLDQSEFHDWQGLFPLKEGVDNGKPKSDLGHDNVFLQPAAKKQTQGAGVDNRELSSIPSKVSG